ncbi:syncoilin [Solea solea]|uniref:syncoilin n=1 Tax=Solea solea TaxID=90069 RepID=UPI00272B6740|nr:syncoilin [Solea solea]
MEDMDDNASSAGFEPLLITEEAGEPDRTLAVQRENNTTQSGLSFAATQLHQSALIRPYLQEMDVLLKSCEELTGISFGSHYSKGFSGTHDSSHGQSEGEVAMESASPQAYLSTNYIDTHMDGAGTEEQPGQGQLQGKDTITSRCGLSTGVCCQTEMPVSSAGNKLSEAMVEYEGQLLGMLSMLESCAEEAGMDFEPQGWTTDESQEYVHISKGTTMVPIQQVAPVKLEEQPMRLEAWAAQRAEGVSRDNSGGSVGSVATRSRQNNLLCCDNMVGVSMEGLEKSGKTDQAVPDPLSVLPGPLGSNENDILYCEGTEMRHMYDTETKRDIRGTEEEDTEMPAEETPELKIGTIDLRSGLNGLKELGSQMDERIQEVQCLEKRRKDLLAEVLKLRGNDTQTVTEGSNKEDQSTEEQTDSKVEELMKIFKREEEERREERKKEIQSLSEERADEERRMWKVNLERMGLQEELRKLKRRLFTMVRECTHSQSSLNNQRREVELLKREEEKLQSLVLQLTEERSQLKLAQEQQLIELQAQLQAQTSQTSNSQEELTEYRRQSCGDIQQYLQGALKTLENRYEPILVALLKRRDTTAGALVKAKEQAQELRAQLRPLQDEIQKLNLQRACLEEKLKLICLHRREDVDQYKETVHCLEESSRELKTELIIQKKKTKAIEELKDSLTKQLIIYRAAINNHNECDGETKT